MLNYLLRRITISVFMLLGVALVSFIVIQLPPGDVATNYKAFLKQQPGVTEEDAERQANLLRSRYGLDQPMPVQFYNWIKGIVTEGKFGFSFAYRRDVGELIAERLPKTLALALLSHIISTFVGLALGIIVATRKYGVLDNVTGILAFILTSIPRFVLALVILYLMVFTFKLPSITGFFSPEFVIAPWSLARVGDMFKNIWPVLVIAGLGGVASNMRVMRGNLLDVLGAQFVTTARSKGLKESAVMLRHAVPNALHPIVAFQGSVLPYMLAGELEAALVLNLPTLAPMFVRALVEQDIFISGSLVLIYSVLTVVGNLLSDIFLTILDPRIRFA
jgi:peptide/nickel transport system permease protein